MLLKDKNGVFYLVGDWERDENHVWKCIQNDYFAVTSFITNHAQEVPYIWVEDVERWSGSLKEGYKCRKTHSEIEYIHVKHNDLKKKYPKIAECIRILMRDGRIRLADIVLTGCLPRNIMDTQSTSDEVLYHTSNNTKNLIFYRRNNGKAIYVKGKAWYDSTNKIIYTDGNEDMCSMVVRSSGTKGTHDYKTNKFDIYPKRNLIPIKWEEISKEAKDTLMKYYPTQSQEYFGFDPQDDKDAVNHTYINNTYGILPQITNQPTNTHKYEISRPTYSISRSERIEGTDISGSTNKASTRSGHLRNTVCSC